MPLTHCRSLFHFASKKREERNGSQADGRGLLLSTLLFSYLYYIGSTNSKELIPGKAGRMFTIFPPRFYNHG